MLCGLMQSAACRHVANVTVCITYCMFSSSFDDLLSSPENIERVSYHIAFSSTRWQELSSSPDFAPALLRVVSSTTTPDAIRQAPPPNENSASTQNFAEDAHTDAHTSPRVSTIQLAASALAWKCGSLWATLDAANRVALIDGTRLELNETCHAQ